jgi:hypothetical protein
MNSEDELAKAFAMIQPIVEEVKEYRIHYEEDGHITTCTMTNHPANTTYVVVSKDEYDNYFRYTIVDSKLKKIDNNPGIRVHLVSSSEGYAVVKNHAGLILEPTDTYDEIEYYDTNR